MSSLDAVLESRLRVAQEEKCQKQKNRYRLMADPLITIQALVACFSNHLTSCQTQDLAMLVEPPAQGPHSFGWHSAPSPEWLVKTSSLLWLLLEVAPNSKLPSKKVLAALKYLYDNKLVSLRTSKTNTVQDCIDKLDFQIRVQMNMLRKLKSSQALRTRCWRMLVRNDQMRLDLLLEKMQLPPEILEGQEEELDESGPACMEVDMLQIVPFHGAPQKPFLSGKGFLNRGHAALAIFQRIMGLFPDSGTPADPEQKSSTSKVSAAFPGPTPTGFTRQKSQQMSNVLDQAMAYEPTKVVAPPSKKESQKKENADSTKTKACVKKKKRNKKNKKGKGNSSTTKAMESKQPVSKKKTKQDKKTLKASQKKEAKKSEKAPSDSSGKESLSEECGFQKYEPHTFKVHQQVWVDDYIEKKWAAGEECKRSQARNAWQTSLKRAQLLAFVSLTELKKRKFVKKDATENPFYKIAMENSNVD
eukprot:Skav225896  [mRNA]  locus=scaffold1460:309840:311258:+ [translate_table: standard]